MNEPKLFEEPELTEAEENNALMPFTSANDTSGRWRWKNIRGFFASLHRRNPLEAVWDDTTLYETTDANAHDRDFSETFNLDIRSGANRHSFADGYTFFEILLCEEFNRNDPLNQITIPPIPANTLNNSSTTAPVGIMSFQDDLTTLVGVNVCLFAKRSNTSFSVAVRDQNSYSTSTGNDLYLCYPKNCRQKTDCPSVNIVDTKGDSVPTLHYLDSVEIFV